MFFLVDLCPSAFCVGVMDLQILSDPCFSGGGGGVVVCGGGGAGVLVIVFW